VNCELKRHGIVREFHFVWRVVTLYSTTFSYAVSFI